MKFLRDIANPGSTNSLATKTRKKNFELFKSFISSFPKPLKILDIGGTQLYWEKMDFTDKESVEILLLNVSKEKVTYPNFKSIKGDARDLSNFKDKEFDIVFSHSVIEHVGEFDDQRKMSQEIRRVGKNYFIQTPNYYFPFEPHFLFPFFQFFPIWLKTELIFNFDIGWYKKMPDKKKAKEIANSIRLLTKKELKELFPDSVIHDEKLMGLTKSFVLYNRKK